MRKIMRVRAAEDSKHNCDVCLSRSQYDIIIGNENIAFPTHLCERCLRKFADILWNFLEVESEDK